MPRASLAKITRPHYKDAFRRERLFALLEEIGDGISRLLKNPLNKWG